MLNSLTKLASKQLNVDQKLIDQAVSNPEAFQKQMESSEFIKQNMETAKAEETTNKTMGFRQRFKEEYKKGKDKAKQGKQNKKSNDQDAVQGTEPNEGAEPNEQEDSGIPKKRGFMSKTWGKMKDRFKKTDEHTRIDKETCEETDCSLTYDRTFCLNTLNGLFYNAFVFILNILIIVHLAIFILTIINYILFSKAVFQKLMLDADDNNKDITKYKDYFSYKLLHYVYCFHEISKHSAEKYTDPTKALESTSTTPAAPAATGSDKTEDKTQSDPMLNYKWYLEDECEKGEPHCMIFFMNRLYNISTKFISYTTLMFIVLLFVQFIILMVLPFRRYEVRGLLIIQYIPMVGKFYMYIFMLLFLSCVANTLLYKFQFIDKVYYNLYSIYDKIIQIDRNVNINLVQEINTKDKAFINLLVRSTGDKLDIEETDIIQSKTLNTIIDNISSTTDMTIKNKKISLYTLFILLKRQNEDDPKVIDTVSKILLQNPENTDTIRGLFPVKLNEQNIAYSINSIISSLVEANVYNNISTEIAVLSNFDILKTYSSNSESPNIDKILTNLSAEIKTYYDPLFKVDDGGFDSKNVKGELDTYLILCIFFSVLFIFCLMFIIYFYANKESTPVYYNVSKFVLDSIFMMDKIRKKPESTIPSDESNKDILQNSETKDQ